LPTNCVHTFIIIINIKKLQKLKYLILTNFGALNTKMPVPVAAQSKTWVCGLSLAGIAGSNSTGGMDVCLL
jgi:hypothetical protein